MDAVTDGSTHLLVEYTLNAGGTVVRPIKLYVSLTPGGAIDQCTSSPIKAKTLVGNIPGLSPGGTCITRTYPFPRAVGAGAVTGNANEPSVSGTVTTANNIWKAFAVTCPANFPHPMAGFATPSCSSKRTEHIFHNANGSIVGIRCANIFLMDRSDLNAAEKANHASTCDSMQAPGTYETAQCAVTCCDL